MVLNGLTKLPDNWGNPFAYKLTDRVFNIQDVESMLNETSLVDLVQPGYDFNTFYEAKPIYGRSMGEGAQYAADQFTLPTKYSKRGTNRKYTGSTLFYSHAQEILTTQNRGRLLDDYEQIVKDGAFAYKVIRDEALLRLLLSPRIESDIDGGNIVIKPRGKDGSYMGKSRIKEMDGATWDLSDPTQLKEALSFPLSDLERFFTIFVGSQSETSMKIMDPFGSVVGDNVYLAYTSALKRFGLTYMTADVMQKYQESILTKWGVSPILSVSSSKGFKDVEQIYESMPYVANFSKLPYSPAAPNSMPYPFFNLLPMPKFKSSIWGQATEAGQSVSFSTETVLDSINTCFAIKGTQAANKLYMYQPVFMMGENALGCAIMDTPNSYFSSSFEDKLYPSLGINNKSEKGRMWLEGMAFDLMNPSAFGIVWVVVPRPLSLIGVTLNPFPSTWSVDTVVSITGKFGNELRDFTTVNPDPFTRSIAPTVSGKETVSVFVQDNNSNMELDPYHQQILTKRLSTASSPDFTSLENLTYKSTPEEVLPSATRCADLAACPTTAKAVQKAFAASAAPENINSSKPVKV